MRKIWEFNNPLQDGLDYEEVTVSTSIVGPTKTPTGYRHLIIQNEGATIRWMAFPNASSTLTGSVGLTLNSDDYFVYDGQLSYLHFIRDTSATTDSIVRLHYFGVIE